MDEIDDVVQVGMGSVGLTMAAVTGQTNHSIAVVEKHENPTGCREPATSTTRSCGYSSRWTATDPSSKIRIRR